MKEPTANQAQRIQRALNRNRAANLSKVWARVDDGQLFVGLGHDSGKLQANDWQRAQTLVSLAEAGLWRI